jgi:hypothetical protein
MIYYSVSDQGGDQPADSEIWKIASDGGAPTQVTVGGGTAAEESYDGKWIFFARQERSAFTTLWRVPSTGGAAVRFADDLVSPAGFAVGRRAVYVIARGTVFGESAFDALDLATAARTRLSTFDKRWFPGAGPPRSDDLSGLALSPDERSLLVSMVNSQGKDLMLMEPAR